MPSFMSQQEFDAGGPQSGGVAGTGAGIGQLANVLAQGPRIRAQAGLLGAETDKTRVETQGLTADQAQKQDVIARQREIMSLASDPNTASNPAARQRLLALGSLDPIIAPHLQTMLSANMGLAALNGLLTARQRDAFSGATGVAAFGNTETGQGAALANTLADTRLKEEGATTRTGMTIGGENYRQGQTLVTGRPAGAPPGSPAIVMPQSQAYAAPGGITPVSDAERLQEGAPITTRPAGSPDAPATTSTTGSVLAAPGTRTPVSAQEQSDLNALVPVVIAGSPSGTKPFLISKREVLASPGKYTEIGATQQGQEAAPTTVLDASGRRVLQGTGEATAQGATPPAGSPEDVWTGVYQRTLPDALAGKPFDLTPPAQPGQPPGPPVPTPQLDANGQPVPGSPLAAVLGARPAPAASMTPVTANSEEGMRLNQLIDQASALHFPSAHGVGGGAPGEWGPQARAAIAARANQLMVSGATRGRADASVEQAIRELQAAGRLDPDAPQGATWGRTFGTGATGTKNIIELKPPKSQDTTDTAPKPNATAPKADELRDYQGKRIGSFGGLWYFVNPDGTPGARVNASAPPGSGGGG